MQVGDLVKVELTGLGKPRRQAMGMLLRPVGTSEGQECFWAVRLLLEDTRLVVPTEDLELIEDEDNASG